MKETIRCSNLVQRSRWMDAVGYALVWMLLSVASVSALPATQRIPSAVPLTTADDGWEGVFAVPGIGGQAGAGTGWVNALVMDGSGNLYAGGDFTIAGGAPANNVARWDGLRWSALGAGLPWVVNALAVDSNGVLYAGGGSQVARWNGAAWTTIGNMTVPVPHGPPAVRVLKLDGSNNLYVGGWFDTVNGVTVRHIARWDGAAWSALGSGVAGGYVASLWVDAVGNLYAGGTFTSAGGAPYSFGLARWNRTNWSAVGSMLPGGSVPFVSVSSLAVVGSDLYVARNDNNNAYGGLLLKWDGANWAALTTTQGGMGTLAIGGDGRLYAGGDFTAIGGVSAQGVARLVGASWAALGGGVSSASALAFDTDGVLYAGGRFDQAGPVAAANIAQWNGVAWAGVGRSGSGGANNAVYALARDGRGGLYVGGAFTSVGGTGNGAIGADRIAYWNGAGWSALGGGLSADVWAIVVSGDNVYAGGDFTSAGGAPASYIARWNGQQWSALGAGMNQPVKALAVDTHGYVYAAGAFTAAGGAPVDGLARWNGAAWESLPGSSAFCQSHACTVNALAFDASGGLHFAGLFDIGGAWRQIARWDGNGFTAAGGAPVGNIVALAVSPDNRDVCVGGEGSFSLPAGVACWDRINTAWTRLGPARGPIRAVAFDASGVLYAGGQPESADDFAVARWNSGSGTWSPLGSEVSGWVYALLADGDRLYVSGSFGRAGPRLSPNIARYAPSGVAPALMINYASGRQGSYFAIAGDGFPANSTGTVTVNGRLLTGALTTDGAGGVNFRLRTDQAAAGMYLATVSVNPSVSVAFRVDASAPLRPLRGAGLTLDVPAGIALDNSLYLPLLRR